MIDIALHETGTPGQPTVVLLHGVGNTGSMWAGLAAALPQYHCLAPDLPATAAAVN